MLVVQNSTVFQWIGNWRQRRLNIVSGKLRELHGQRDAVDSGSIKVSKLHSLHVQIFGNPQGQPALVVHGGPGASCWTKHSRFFDLDHYMVVLVDQRGCGKSTPRGCLVANNTQRLISDFEKIREELEIKQWLLFGGSWGVTLSLAYAQKHPQSVCGMILRGVCLMRKQEIEWMFGGGCQSLNPYAWDAFIQSLHESDRQQPCQAYYKLLTCTDKNIALEAAKRWLMWDMSVQFATSNKDKLQLWDGSSWIQDQNPGMTSSGNKVPPSQTKPGVSANPFFSEKGGVDTFPPSDQVMYLGNKFRGGDHVHQQQVQALLEAHYCVNLGFLEAEPILHQIDRIRHIPCIAVQGRIDLVCPVRTACDLVLQWPEMELRIVPGAGHSMYDPPIQHELLEATDRMKTLHKIS